VQNKLKKSISQNFTFIFCETGQLLSLCGLLKTLVFIAIF